MLCLASALFFSHIGHLMLFESNNTFNAACVGVFLQLAQVVPLHAARRVGRPNGVSDNRSIQLHSCACCSCLHSHRARLSQHPQGQQNRPCMNMPTLSFPIMCSSYLCVFCCVERLFLVEFLAQGYYSDKKPFGLKETQYFAGVKQQCNRTEIHYDAIPSPTASNVPTVGAIGYSSKNNKTTVTQSHYLFALSAVNDIHYASDLLHFDSNGRYEVRLLCFASCFSFSRFLCFPSLTRA